MSTALFEKPLDTSNLRYWQQNASAAIQNIFDAITELVTNADDAYERLGRGGRIEIEIERRRKGTARVLRVRDFASGMTGDVMDNKLSKLANRHDSGLAEGAKVRGTNSRGAKDVAALGTVTFESITANGRYSRCQITPQGMFIMHEDCGRVTGKIRSQMGIPRDCGTLVTIDLVTSVSIHQHGKMVKKLQLLVPLRDILSDPDRQVSLRDVTQDRKERLRYHAPEGIDRVKERLKIPGYPDAQAKLIIKRAKRRLDRGEGKFREGGIVIKSRRAIHEATLFDPSFEHDAHAEWFFGSLRCEYIDELWNRFDERNDEGLSPETINPDWIIDPMRQGGVRRKHPFVAALFKEVLKWLRPLVEEERKRAESQRAQIESAETRRRLNTLEKAATRFFDEYQEEDEETIDSDLGKVEGGFQRKGFGLNPPFAQIVVSHKQKYWLNVSQVRFPELAVGSMVQIECETDEISTNKRYCPLESHPNRENTLRCTWEIRGEQVTPTTGVTVRVGAIVASAIVEVLESERDRYADVKTFCFERQRYRVKPGVPKKIRLLAPCPGLVSAPTSLRLEYSNRDIEIRGDRTLLPREKLGIAECKLRVIVSQPDVKVSVIAVINGHSAEAELVSGPPPGESIKIEIKDIDLGNQRSRWRGSLLEIAARHPSLNRYLGPPKEFPGQEKDHFRVLLAEIVAYAVCEHVLTRNAITNPEEYQDLDLEALLAERDKLVTKFLPIAHESQLANPG